MGARMGFDGRMEFSDDNPIELDCGCIAEAGDDYYECAIRVWDARAEEVVKLSFTYCGDECCKGRMLAELLEQYSEEETHHIDSAEDSANEYADYRYDESVTDRLILEGDY